MRAVACGLYFGAAQQADAIDRNQTTGEILSRCSEEVRDDLTNSD